MNKMSHWERRNERSASSMYGSLTARTSDDAGNRRPASDGRSTGGCSIEWSVSRDGFTFGAPISNADVINPYFTSADNGLYYSRCRITLPGGQMNTLTNYTTVDICNGCRVGQSGSENGSIGPNGTDENTSLRLTTSPNPVSGNAINLNFTLPEEAAVSVTMTNGRAASVRKLDFGVLKAGIYQKQIDVVNLASGLYVISLQAGSQVRSQKVLLNK